MRCRPWEPPALRTVAEEYRALKHEGGPAFQELARTGRIAAQAHAAGGHSFGPRKAAAIQGRRSQHFPPHLAERLSRLATARKRSLQEEKSASFARRSNIAEWLARESSNRAPLHPLGTPVPVGAIPALPATISCSVSQWHLPACSFAMWLLDRCKGAGPTLRTDWLTLHKMVVHAEVPPLSGIPKPRTSQVRTAGMQFQPKHALLHPYVVALTKTLRQMCPKGSQRVQAIHQGRACLLLRQAETLQDGRHDVLKGGQRLWLHLSHVDLNTWQAAVLPLRRGHEQECAIAKTLGQKALVVDVDRPGAEQKYQFHQTWWTALAGLDLQTPWAWRIWVTALGHEAQEPFRPGHLRLVLPTATEPWTWFWHGPPLHRRSRHRRSTHGVVAQSAEGPPSAAESASIHPRPSSRRMAGGAEGAPPGPEVSASTHEERSSRAFAAPLGDEEEEDSPLLGPLVEESTDDSEDNPLAEMLHEVLDQALDITSDSDPGSMDEAVAEAGPTSHGAGTPMASLAPAMRGQWTKVPFENFGEIRLDAERGRIDAHCYAHRCVDGSDCKADRLTLASTCRGREGQGRPLGFLAAWLMYPALHQSCRTKEHHHHVKAILSKAAARKQRMEARERLRRCPGTACLFESERAQREGEPDEPCTLP